MRDLAAIQHRFYALVTAGEGAIEPGLLGGSRRLDVYAEMYIARLHDILADDFPKLRAALGEETFHASAVAYVRACPPASVTVRDLGARLAGYLATRADLPAWSADLAALEWARIDVFDAADAAPLTRDDVAALPHAQFPALALGFVPASRLVTLGWSVDELWSAIEDDTAREAPAPGPRTVLAWRRELHVLHRTLDTDEAALAPLVAAGASLAEISARLAETGANQPEQRMVELLARWLDAEVLVPAPARTP